MKTAIYIEDGVTQVVLTPETDWEKKAIAALENQILQVKLFAGEFYDCRGGWVRQAEYHPLYRYGSGGHDISYVKAAEFLDDLPLIEDWGCGSTYAGRFFKRAEYIGIDGSSPMALLKADLQTYQSNVPGILMRHVLEHNRNWQRVLHNAIASFQRKFCLVMFLEFGP